MHSLFPGLAENQPMLEQSTHRFWGSPYFSMEYVDGGTLADELTGEPFTSRAAAEILHSLALAIHEAHEKQVIHRDLKPANILLGKKVAGAERLGAVLKITDFGLAKQLDDVGDVTRTGVLLGTIAYMAPEQAEGRVKETGPATDIHALGCILYELLTGKTPFRSDKVLDTLVKIRTKDPGLDWMT